jgi:glycolate oxidase FAD binding subunit
VGTDFWHDLREHRLQFFASDLPLWRLSLPPQAPPVALAEQQLLEWGGGQRWLASETQPQQIFAAAAAVGGHATRFRGGDRTNSFQPLDAVGQRLHAGLKVAFDPAGVLNRDRLYPEA